MKGKLERCVDTKIAKQDMTDEWMDYTKER